MKYYAFFFFDQFFVFFLLTSSVSMLASSVVDVGLSPAPSQTKGLKNWYLLLSANHAA